MIVSKQLVCVWRWKTLTPKPLAICPAEMAILIDGLFVQSCHVRHKNCTTCCSWSCVQAFGEQVARKHLCSTQTAVWATNSSKAVRLSISEGVWCGSQKRPVLGQDLLYLVPIVDYIANMYTLRHDVLQTCSHSPLSETSQN